MPENSREPDQSDSWMIHLVFWTGSFGSLIKSDWKEDKNDFLKFENCDFLLDEQHSSNNILYNFYFMGKLSL